MSIVSPNKVESVPPRPKVGDKNFKIGDGATFHGNFVVADLINSSFNAVEKSTATDEMKGLLKNLTHQVGEMIKSMPEKDAKKVEKNFDMLVKEATSEEPDQQWYEVSAKGLVEAAKALGEAGKPILELVPKVLALLG